MDWDISNFSEIRKYSDSIQRKSFHCCPKIIFNEFTINNVNILFFIDGYVLPRKKYYKEYSKSEQPELLKNLYIKFGLNFIKYIKGVFNILLIVGEEFYIFNDRHSIKKFFIYRNCNRFLISNNLKVISKKVNLQLDKENAVLFCLMEHFIDGKTLFKNVTYSKPASKLFYSKSLQFDHYWYPDELLNLEVKKYSFDELAEKWRTIIRQYVTYLKPEAITMTLTGGNDSRMILSALLNLGIKPNAFTFGNPNSFDGVVAAEVARCADLNYHNYYVKNPTSEWFEQYGNKIIEIGNSLINIHRAHRLDAIERELESNPANEMIFGGFMGGEYLKGIPYDDYIIPKLFRKWEENNLHSLEKELLYILEEKKIDLRKIKIDEICNYLGNLKYLNYKNKKEREFCYLFYHCASIHHSQDPNIFMSYCKYVVNPFMDDDFLEILFSSKYSMLKKNTSSINQFKRVDQPRFHCEIMHRLAPELSDIKFAKKGYYTVNEFLGNRYACLFKRFYRYKINRKYYQPNFPYRAWLREFIKQNLFNNKSEALGIFNIEKLNSAFMESTNHYNEGYWHLFTNPINLLKNVQYYINGDL